MKRLLIATLALGAMFLSVHHVDAAEQADGKRGQLCWTEDQCKERMTMEGKAFTPGESFVLNKTECGASNLGYCYPPPLQYKLLIPFGAVSTVKGIPGYVQAAFSLAVVFGTIGVILTTMIAGLQWMTARGNPGAAGKAREKIEKSMTTLIILLLVITFARLVDPRLATLRQLRTPLIKEVNYLDPGTTCEALQKPPYNFVVEPKTGKCGEKGKITSIGDQGKGGATTIGLTVGDECVFRGCNDANIESCVNAGGKYQCIRCGNVSSVSKAQTGIAPSESVCQGMSFWAKDIVDEKLGIKMMCEYYNAPVTGGSFDSCVELQYPFGQAGIECGRLRDQASTYGGVSCRLYELVEGNGRDIRTHLTLQGNKVEDYPGAWDDYPLAHAVCGGDPCGFAPEGSSCNVILYGNGVRGAVGGSFSFVSKYSNIYCADAQSSQEINAAIGRGDWIWPDTVLDENGNPIATTWDWIQ